MTVTLDAEESVTETSGAAGAAASWTARAGAFTIDVLFGLGVVATALLVWLSAPPQGWLWWLSLLIGGAALMAVLVNRLLLPSATGWSLGRSVFGIAVVSRAGDAVSPWRLLLRDLAHLLDTAPLFLGWLWPLVDSRGRTFADVLVRTEVHRIDGARPVWRGRVFTAIAAVAGLATVAAGVGYLGVYRQELAVAQAREQIAVQGPKIVADLLTYRAASVQDDFGRAQSLVTDGYRPTWTAQQDAIRKAGAVDNDYWVTNSAVLDSTKDRATMLLLLQGQRGIKGNQRFISASVRAGFEKSGSGDWRVSDLTVLTAPKSGGGGG
ncbi:MAG: RDD family protein [Mycobacterium sp.]